MNTSAADLRVLVTAGAAGIGLSIATTFADAGARVFVCDINRDALSALNTACPSIGIAPADVSNPAEVAVMFAEAVACLGGLNVLVNNAGIAGPTAKVEDISIEDWGTTIGIDLNGMFYSACLAVPLLKSAGGGTSSTRRSDSAGSPLRATTRAGGEVSSSLDARLEYPPAA
jgi:NAD(P)-dependent dehydrogenase (short-subunit alcohol dehydrogenase family)